MLAGLSKLGAAARFAIGLQRFIRTPLTPAECRNRVRGQLESREASFLDVVDRCVFKHPRSPYAALLRHLGIAQPDVARLVRDAGVEGALNRLFDAGVHVSLDEFKGRRPIVRPGFECHYAAADFDNPVGGARFLARTGGSRGTPTRLVITLDLLAHEACYSQLFLEGLEFNGPIALWRPAPPGKAGLSGILRYTKIGRCPARWFSQQPCSLRVEPAQSAFALLVVYAARAAGASFPMPEHVPVADAVRVAQWAAEQVQLGRPGLIDTNAASAVRVCAAAADCRLAIAGTWFRVGGEPYTEAKAQIIQSVGCRAVSHYTLSEIGHVGAACVSSDTPDDCHLLSDKAAVVQRPVTPNGSETPVGGLFLTALLLAGPKVMINVESGDYGTLQNRRCSCPLDAIGLRDHLHSIRSYEKLTSEGMHFIGADLLTLLEDELPRRFGGRATDYQFAEEEVNGLPVVRLLVSPRVGTIDEGAVRDAVLEALAVRGGHASSRMMSDRWREADTLVVTRREPRVTGAGKVLALHASNRRTPKTS